MRFLHGAPKWALAWLIALAATQDSPALAQDVDACLACHEEPSLFEEMDNPSRLVVTSAGHEASLHGSLGVGCVDCHTDVRSEEDLPHPERLEPAACGGCHPGVQKEYDASLHGYALARGNPRAPTCASCHGAHDILPASDAGSRTSPERLANTCASCHGTAGLTTDRLVRLPQTFAGYARSVHGRPSASAGGVAASCSDCHGVHDLLGHENPASRINPANVSATCGRCHDAVRAEYDGSIHGQAQQAGISDSPTCNDCHGEHLVLSPSDPDSRTYARSLATQICGKCHDDPEIVGKYGMRGGVVGSYVDSYHGWAVRREYERAATCVSCHTAHAVLPEQHPDSSIHADNVQATCGKCHEKADRRFAASYTHEAVSVTANPINRWIRNVYWMLIAVVIGAMLLHNAVIMNYFLVEKLRRIRGQPSVRRFDASQIVQHMLLATSFIALVVTGFALRYPEAWWVRHLGALGMSEPVRANLHRVFGVVLIVLSLYHVGYLLWTRRGQRELRRIAPRSRDLRELVDNLRFHTWRTRRRPGFGRFDYTQKAEYWALVWGTALMAVTGLVLWFPVLAVRLMPSWIVTAAQTVHFYEAWLATLAIVVWHFFFVLFHPEVYPMSWTWLTGKIPEDEVARHHPGWHDDEPSPPAAEIPERKGPLPGRPKVARRRRVECNGRGRGTQDPNVEGLEA